MNEPIKVSGPAAHEHNLPKGKLVSGHKIVVEGLYLSSEINAHNGHFEKKKIAYREEFTLAPSEHRVHAQGALGHILSDKLLAERLSSKDKNFRAIQTHKVVKHENVLV